MVIMPNTLLNFGRDGDKTRVGLLCCCIIPAPQRSNHRLERHTQRGRQILARRIGVIFPYIASWRKTVTEMRNLTHLNAMTEPTLVTQNAIITGMCQVHSSKSQGIEWEIPLMMPVYSRQMVHPGRANVPFAIRWGHLLAPVDTGVNRCKGEKLVQVLQDPFRATQLIEPIVNQG
ncbi:MAG: hypothetical protein BWY63_03406 [Chloroflexi bacterium ADurb.Bin360]|nr:MAG: hypothetical protein BWY63_03406 [Chloroflexi bacterium ADurb.Bin360]